uniref:Pentatricopeptide repeat-containing protein n=1 Tax=Populus alba TaxID=43335 RepID=A0A4U5NMI7_POPAL|nr:hypothetical protein D5086_0000252200 [Populus alba]
MKDEGFELDVVTCGVLINARCKVRRYDDAIELFLEMEARNCKPSPHIHCILINGLGAEKRVDMAIKVRDRMKAKGGLPEMLDVDIRPPAQLFSYLKQNLLDEGKKDIVAFF